MKDTMTVCKYMARVKKIRRGFLNNDIDSHFTEDDFDFDFDAFDWDGVLDRFLEEREWFDYEDDDLDLAHLLDYLDSYDYDQSEVSPWAVFL